MAYLNESIPNIRNTYGTNGPKEQWETQAILDSLIQENLWAN